MIPLRDNIPSRHIPLINYLFIVANTAIFLYQVFVLPQEKIETFFITCGVVPIRLLNKLDLWTIFTSMFIHGSWVHFIGNMLYLYIFGDNVEDKLGHIKYIIFYLACGIGAAFVQVLFSMNSRIPLVGASGAIAGVLGAYCVSYPRARILTLVPLGFFTRIVPIPAFFYLGFWFIVQTFSGTVSLALPNQQNIGGIAWWAHTSGFLFGILLLYIMSRRRRLQTYYYEN